MTHVKKNKVPRVNNELYLKVGSFYTLALIHFSVQYSQKDHILKEELMENLI